MRAVSGMVVLALAVMGLAPWAGAQTGTPYNSVEWLVAAADVIVRASIADAAKDRTSVTLQVEEVLKGEAPSSIRMTFEQNTNPSDFAEMKARGARLWFLTKKDQDYAAPDGIYHGSYHIGLSPEEPKSWQGLPLFRMNFDVIKEPGALLAAVRESVRTEPHPAELKMHSIHMHSGLMTRLKGGSNGLDFLTLPVDARLETVAQEMIRNPERFGEGTDLMEWLRFEGIKALRYFPSPENRTLLAPLLGDPSERTRDAMRAVLQEWDAAK